MRLLLRPLKGCLGVILGIACATSLQGAIIVGPGGSSATLIFDALPPATNWSTLSVAGGAGDITDSGALHTAVIANASAAAITATLGSSGTQPPSQNAVARWNNVGFYLQTRPTGNNYLVLMATVQNG